jgi:hypothetical protein
VRGTTAPREVHHRVARCVLRLRDRADACADPLSAEGLALWLDYELEALRFGVDPDISRDELAALIEGSTVEIAREEHRNGHASDLSRWGRRGGLVTVRRYGTAWFVLLAARRWERVTAEELSTVLGSRYHSGIFDAKAVLLLGWRGVLFCKGVTVALLVLLARAARTRIVAAYSRWSWAHLVVWSLASTLGFPDKDASM